MDPIRAAGLRETEAAVPDIRRGPPAPAPSAHPVPALLLIAAAAFLAYADTFDASFHLDDVPNIVKSENVRDLRLQWPPSGRRYLGSLSLALNYHLGGLEVFGYHLANLLLHACNGLLLFWLTAVTLRTPTLRRAEAGPLVRRYLPLAAALLFVVHPVATQAVTYIIQRFTSLATSFFLLSIVLYAQARLACGDSPSSRRRAGCLLGLSFVTTAAAMKTKEIGFTLPFAAALYEWLFFPRTRWRLFLLAPLAAAAVMIPLGLFAPEKGWTTTETTEISRAAYLLTQARVVLTYLRLLVLPIKQNLDYDFRISDSLADPAVLLALAVISSVVGLAAWLLARACRAGRAEGVLVFFGTGWFFLTLAVESSVFPIRDVIFEHRVYLPSAGASVALATVLLWAVERLRLPTAPRVQAAAALLLTAGPLGVATYERNLVWKDEVTLWSDTVAKSPDKSRPHHNLAEAYWGRGDVDAAIREDLEALRVDPRYVLAHNGLGESYRAKGRFDEAISHLREAVRLDPALADARNNLCAAYGQVGRFDEAIVECRLALALRPRSANAHTNLGNINAARGEVDAALKHYRAAVRIDPDLAVAHQALGALHQARGELEDAVREYRSALRLEPGLAVARANVAACEKRLRNGGASTPSPSTKGP